MIDLPLMIVKQNLFQFSQRNKIVFNQFISSSFYSWQDMLGCLFVPKFIMEAKETTFDYLTVHRSDVQIFTESDEKDIRDIRNDVRKVVIAYLKGK